MPTSLQDKLNQFSPERQTKIRARADRLIAEEMSLRDLRLARKLTQEKLAELLKIRQEGVSRLEKRSDLHLSTLRDVLQAMGGELRLVVEFPDRPPVILSGLQEPDESGVETV
jgi:transcriptional regulator with XRE-family HTH domain